MGMSGANAGMDRGEEGTRGGLAGRDGARVDEPTRAIRVTGALQRRTRDASQRIYSKRTVAVEGVVTGAEVEVFKYASTQVPGVTRPCVR